MHRILILSAFFVGASLIAPAALSRNCSPVTRWCAFCFLLFCGLSGRGKRMKAFMAKLGDTTVVGSGAFSDSALRGQV